MTDQLPITAEDVLATGRRLKGLVRRTPLVSWDLGRPPGDARLYLKLEHLQLSGSFKTRGAQNALAALPTARLRNGVVTASGSNHGLAVAFAARRRELPELFHEMLEHRHRLAEAAGREVTNPEALADYLTTVLPARPEEQQLLE